MPHRHALLSCTCLWIALLASGRLQSAEPAATELSHLKFDVAELARNTDGIYCYEKTNHRGVVLYSGRLTFRLRQTDDRQVLLRDTVDVFRKNPEGKVEHQGFEAQLTCRPDDALAVEKLVVNKWHQVEASPRTNQCTKLTVSTDRTTATVARDAAKEPRTLKWTPDTLTDLMVFRMITQLPREKGKQYVLGRLLSSDRAALRTPFVIRCDGPVTLDRRGRRVPAVQFSLWENGDEPRERECAVFVSPTGRLERLAFGRKIIDRAPRTLF